MAIGSQLKAKSQEPKAKGNYKQQAIKVRIKSEKKMKKTVSIISIAAIAMVMVFSCSKKMQPISL
ncbi:MAG: hypothetical protein R2764_21340 [Bacteroidales bacterium]